jgi:hypothetical protein
VVSATMDRSRRPGPNGRFLRIRPCKDSVPQCGRSSFNAMVDEASRSAALALLPVASIAWVYEALSSHART